MLMLTGYLHLTVTVLHLIIWTGSQNFIFDLISNRELTSMLKCWVRFGEVSWRTFECHLAGLDKTIGSRDSKGIGSDPPGGPGYKNNPGGAGLCECRFYLILFGMFVIGNMNADGCQTSLSWVRKKLYGAPRLEKLLQRWETRPSMGHKVPSPKTKKSSDLTYYFWKWPNLTK